MAFIACMACTGAVKPISRIRSQAIQESRVVTWLGYHRPGSQLKAVSVKRKMAILGLAFQVGQVAAPQDGGRHFAGKKTGDFGRLVEYGPGHGAPHRPAEAAENQRSFRWVRQQKGTGFANVVGKELPGWWL